MEKVRLIVLLLGISTLVISACSPTAEPTAIAVIAPSTQVEQPIASSTPEQVEQLATLTESPTDIPPTPTLVPTPTIPRGTLTHANESGFGSGFNLSPLGLQLSPDEKRLIASTTAGIFIFSTDDLSPLLAIHEPVVDFGNMFRPSIRITPDGTRAVTFDEPDAKVRVWDLTTGALLGEYPVGTNGEILGMNSIRDFIITPDNQQVAMLFGNGTILVMNLDDGEIAQKIETYVHLTDYALRLLFDSAGKYVHYIFEDLAGDSQSIKLDGNSWKEVSRKVGGRMPRGGAISPRLSSSGYDFG